MSRKRAPPPPDSTSEGPNAKRHLNSALAAELQTLRISGERDPLRPPRHAFGASVASSPFLTSSQQSRFPYTANTNGLFPYHPFGQGTGVDLNTDFADALVHEPEKASREVTPEVFTPGSSSSSSMSMALDDMNAESKNFEVYPWRLETSNDDIIVEDVEAPLQSTADENRLVVYRPPMKTSSDALKQLNARLPHTRYLIRNTKTDEWMVKEVNQNHDRYKRKLAVVPWRGDMKKLCDNDRRPAAVIPMPWHDSQPAPADAEQVMEIEDIS